MTRSIALATCPDLPTGDEDSRLVEAALAAVGIEGSWQVWSAADVDWPAFDLVVVRSTWDYTRDLDGFIAWAGGVPKLANPAEVINWNTDKTYLRDAAQIGVPIVATAWSGPGETVELPDGEFVVKPSVGAGSRGVGRFDADRPGALDAARRHAASLHRAGRTVMVQPYLAEVDMAGETALVYFGGAFSHAIRKAAMLPASGVHELSPGLSTGLFVPERITPREAAPDELRLGEQVLEMLRARFGGDLLYTRIDILQGPAGPVVIELELTEPSFFLGHDEGAADRFAAAVAGWLG